MMVFILMLQEYLRWKEDTREKRANLLPVLTKNNARVVRRLGVAGSPNLFVRANVRDALRADQGNEWCGRSGISGRGVWSNMEIPNKRHNF